MSINIRPSLNKIAAFDCYVGTTVNFSWTGGQARANRIVIRELETNTLVYDCKETTMALKHTLHLQPDESDKSYSQEVRPALENGKKYKAVVYVYDTYGDESLPSNEIQFYCFNTPIFEFVNFDKFDETTHIAKVSYNSVYLKVNFQQANNETLSEYYFALYDYAGNELLRSGSYYGSGNPDNLQYTLGGVTDTERDAQGNLRYDRYYRAVCQGVTTHGMEVYTEQKFIVQKDVGGVGSLIRLEKTFDNNIVISSNFKVVKSSIDGDEIYLNDEENNPYAIDLTNDQKVKYFDSFKMKKPWSITAIISGCKSNSVLIKASNSEGDGYSISYKVRRYSKNKKAFFLFEEKNGANRTILKSNDLPITDKWYIVYLKFDGYYTFQVYDPEEFGYDVPEIEDTFMKDHENDLVKKLTIESEVEGLGDHKYTNVTAVFDLSPYYNFESGKRYTVRFKAENYIKNNFRYLTINEPDNFDVTSDAKVTSYIGNDKYVLDHYATDELLAPTITVTWSFDCSITKVADYIVGSFYCILSELYIGEYVTTYGELEQYTHEFLSHYTYGTIRSPGIPQETGEVVDE